MQQTRTWQATARVGGCHWLYPVSIHPPCHDDGIAAQSCQGEENDPGFQPRGHALPSFPYLIPPGSCLVVALLPALVVLLSTPAGGQQVYQSL
mmetsp:Transcript_30122/g.62060  ORF Transcript_30122/g.62060 Transcript_30122/m.62060 type:complete len:93 (+) Transcript_30122:1381-1659(+)